MALGTKVNIRKITHRGKRVWLATYLEGTRRRKKYFDRKVAAEDFQATREKESRSNGIDHNITPAERAAILEFRDELDSIGATTRDALSAYIKSHRELERSAPVERLCRELIARVKAERKSPTYLRDLRSILGRFESDFGQRVVASIECEEISDWLAALDRSPVTVSNYRRHLVMLFQEGIRRRYIRTNPAKESMKPKIIEGTVGILTPTEAANLLSAADDAIVPAIAIGMFAGVRTAELNRLDWQDIDLNRGRVEIKAAKAKSAMRRLIPISDNLAAWLAPYERTRGPIMPRGARRLHEEARHQAGFGEKKPWPSNALRHSFASYHLAHHQDSARLALEMGHQSSGLIFSHYREVVTPEDAAEFWAIMPARNDKLARIV